MSNVMSGSSLGARGPPCSQLTPLVHAPGPSCPAKRFPMDSGHPSSVLLGPSDAGPPGEGATTTLQAGLQQ